MAGDPKSSNAASNMKGGGQYNLHMENFHIDILQNILSRLSFGEALYARRVCKTWKTLVVDRWCIKPGFLFVFNGLVKTELNICYGERYDDDGDIIDDTGHVNKMNYYYTHETLTRVEHESLFNFIDCKITILVGSCNGLVCFKRYRHGNPFLIINPLTEETFFLPDIDYTSPLDTIKISWGLAERVVCGFGYCQSTNDYKVVKICYDNGLVKQGQVQVLTIGTDKWRSLGSTDHRLGSISYSESFPGIFANGAIHWIDQIEYKVVAFDLEDEKFRVFTLPLDDVDADIILSLLGGNLCLVHVELGSEHPFMDIWAYKQNNDNSSDTNTTIIEEGHGTKRDYYNNSWNWTKEFHIECEDDSYEPFAITKSNLVLMWNHSRILHCYDPKTSTIYKLWDSVNVMGLGYIDAVPYTTSGVSLKDHIEEKKRPK
ncbi:F-box protein At3g07870-like [Papaver somniferum]|uniref:F-box protein At3g07870-like n=1 Tax=Papaver somniferum TaxID=3469 RepID=UPI000E6F907E|nr:F-box protein At3g07870-like [Papaver somniferum]